MSHTTSLVVSFVFLLSHAAMALESQRVSFFVENLEDGSSGKFVVDVHPDWAPVGAEHFLELVKKNFFDDSRFFRVTTGFLAEFGIAAIPEVTAEWQGKTIKDDPKKMSNLHGRLSFVNEGPDTRSTQVVISIQDNELLDKRGNVPFGEVVEGMWVVERLYQKYRSTVPQRRLKDEGNAFVAREFPKLSWLKTVAFDGPSFEPSTPQVTQPGLKLSSFQTVIALSAAVMAGLFVNSWARQVRGKTVPSKGDHPKGIYPDV